jgi:hypothetical protein
MSHTGRDYLFLSRLKDLFRYIHGVSLCGSPPNIQDREQRGIETTDGFFILVDLPHHLPTSWMVIFQDFGRSFALTRKLHLHAYENNDSVSF